ncbi:MAG: hypothetical protein AAGE94_09760 [Acidobacteriota bacterium]
MRLRSMPTVPFRVLVAVLLVLGLGSAAPSPADELGFFEVRKVRNAANKALTSGDLSEAVTQFTRLAEGTTGDRRAEALYFAAVAELGQDGGKPDTARGWLDTLLSEAPRHELAPQARALVRLLEQVAGVQQQVDAAMASADAAMASAARQAEQHDDREEQAAGEVESLSSQVERLAAELRATRAELAKKEEALEKLKQVVSGGDG